MTVQSNPHTLAVGETLVDVVTTYGQPGFPIEIPGGSPANVALTLGRLDRPVALATQIGLDERGRLIDFRMYDSGMHVTGVSRGASHTPTALARLDESGTASYTFDLEWASAPPITVPPTAQIIGAGSISAIIEPGASAVLDALTRGRGHALVCSDPNVHPSTMGKPTATLVSLGRSIALADIVKVSDRDIRWLTGDTPISEVVNRQLGMGASLVVVTHGKHGGLTVISSGMRFTKTPSDVKAIDTAGAGDSSMGGMTDAIWGMGLRDADARTTLRTLPGEQIRAIIDRASIISDVTVSRKDVNPPWAHELS